MTDLAQLLDPRPTNCETLYDELVDSSIDILVNNVGSLMYFLAYDSPVAPIVQKSGFSMDLYEKIKGEGLVSEDLLLSKFPSLGHQRRITEKVVKLSADIECLEDAIAYFQRKFSEPPGR